MTHADRVSVELGWIGIALGVAELAAPSAVARAAGLEGHESLLRLFGLREIGAGLALLAAREPARWLWLRAAGDGLDGALLAHGMRPGNRRRARSFLAALALAPIVALDLIHTAHAARPRGGRMRS